MNHTDRIEKSLLLKAPIARVWQAISDASHFGAWFGLRCEGPFVAGRKLRCTIAPTTVDPEVAEKQKEHEGVAFHIWVREIVPERRLSFEWLPNDPDADEETAPKTLVTFELSEQDGGVRLVISESGFDQLPPGQRTESFARNDEGWAMQLRNIEGYLAPG